MIKAKLSFKFYIFLFLLLGIVMIGWYGIYFLNTKEVLMDGAPMDSGMKTGLTVVMTLIVSSWSLSFLTMARQGISGYAFYMDESGICSTASIIMIFAFIFAVPVKRIPYHAIEWVGEENDLFLIKINKSKIEVFPLFRPLVRKEYYFFAGFTKEKMETVRVELDSFMRKSHSQDNDGRLFDC